MKRGISAVQILNNSLSSTVQSLFWNLELLWETWSLLNLLCTTLVVTVKLVTFVNSWKIILNYYLPIQYKEGETDFQGARDWQWTFLILRHHLSFFSMMYSIGLVLTVLDQQETSWVRIRHASDVTDSFNSCLKWSSSHNVLHTTAGGTAATSVFHKKHNFWS